MNQRPFTAGEMPSASAPDPGAVLATNTGQPHSAAQPSARTQKPGSRCVMTTPLRSRAIANQAERADADPYDIQRGGRQRAVVAAVDHEAGGTDYVHPMIDGGLAVEFAGGEQSVGGQDDYGGQPADDFDEQFQAATSAGRSAYCAWRRAAS